MKIAVLPGDGIGPEIMREAVKVLNGIGESFEFEEAPIGGAGYDASGDPLPDATLAIAKAADAILLGATGDGKYDRARPQAPPGAGHAAVARKRREKVCNVDKANVLETSQVWRDTGYPRERRISGYRTVARFRTRHRRKGPGESPRHDPIGGNDAALFVGPSRAGHTD